MTDARTAADLTMELAGSGTKMPLLGLGTWQLRGSACRRAVGWALEVGYRHIDTAAMYGNESEVGAAIAASGLDRAAVFVTTKMPPERAGGRELRTLQDSLRALGTNYVDLWLVHWPPRGSAGVTAWRAFIQAQRDGLARAIGVSNYSISQIDQLAEETRATPAVNQTGGVRSSTTGRWLRPATSAVSSLRAIARSKPVASIIRSSLTLVGGTARPPPKSSFDGTCSTSSW
jgi:hypothetical protein